MSPCCNAIPPIIPENTITIVPIKNAAKAIIKPLLGVFAKRDQFGALVAPDIKVPTVIVMATVIGIEVVVSGKILNNSPNPPAASILSFGMIYAKYKNAGIAKYAIISMPRDPFIAKTPKNKEKNIVIGTKYSSIFNA